VSKVRKLRKATPEGRVEVPLGDVTLVFSPEPPPLYCRGPKGRFDDVFGQLEDLPDSDLPVQLRFASKDDAKAFRQACYSRSKRCGTAFSMKWNQDTLVWIVGREPWVSGRSGVRGEGKRVAQ